MTDADNGPEPGEAMPERIWAGDGESPYFYVPGEVYPSCCTPYVRADLLAEAMRFVEMVARLDFPEWWPDDRQRASLLGTAGNVRFTAGDIRAARALSARLRGESA